MLNEDLGYVGRPQDVRLIPGAAAAVRRLREVGYATVVVSNQSGVARGYFETADAEAVNARLAALLREADAGAEIDAFYWCPYLAEAAVEAWRHPDHPDRKPNPGMLLRAARELDLDLSASLMIGDKPSDMEAARRAGVRGLLFAGGDLDAFVRRALES